MPYKGHSSITVTDALYNKIKSKHHENYVVNHVKPSLSDYVENILWYVLESDDILKKYAPFLEKDKIADNTIFIKDNRVNRIAELIVQDGDLYCLLDERKDCVHIGFAWSIPEVYKIMAEHGRKKPDIK